MALSVIQKLSYGMYVVTSLDGKSPKGCIANCAVQITSEPATFAVSVNHNNYTNKCIKKTGKFAISVLAEDCDPTVIGTFGFKSSETVDKFKAVNYKTVEGLPVLTDSCGYLVCEVVDSMETSTHTVFLGKLIASETFASADPMTYSYYHRVVKGASPKNAPTYVPPEQLGKDEPAEQKKGKRKYVCAICGYEYEGDELPEGFECPICGVGAEMFSEVK
ncbi:MAG: flavin reductase [Clostridiales bacterium]|nr:flavin reductase [Clostridiales bacterium]